MEFPELEFDFEGLEDNAEVPEGPIDRRSRTVVCKHWLIGLCQKGKKCTHLHQFDLSRMPVCAVWTKKHSCTDYNCVFKHVDGSGTKPCPRYNLGLCMNGPSCNLRHDHSLEVPYYLPDNFFEEMFHPQVKQSLPMRCDELFRQHITVEKPPVEGFSRYFLTKSPDRETVLKAMETDLWTTSRRCQLVLNEALRQEANVILVFKAVETKQFIGIAQMLSQKDPVYNLYAVPVTVGGKFKIKWLKKTTLDFSETHHLKNPYNARSPVCAGEDAQEIEDQCAIKLCSLMTSKAEAERKRRATGSPPKAAKRSKES